jgi:pyruvate dehydrogenase E1 component alpha subunit
MNVGREAALRYLRDMLRVRRFEEKCAEVYSAGHIRGFLHLYIGEEAVACGVLPELGADDAVLATYREHGHALVRGIPTGTIMAEMYGRKEGCSRGRGGSMHLFDVSRRFYGGNAIVGGALPMAEGEFHESANLAALWQLPVLFCCENNLYAMGTALDRSEADTDLCEKARSYRIAAASADGMDVLAVADAARLAADYVRSGRGPYFLELRTYRFRAHSMFDPELYRSKAEVEHWKQRCPIATFTAQMQAAGLLTPADVAAIEGDVAREIAAAVAFAEAGTLEPVEALLDDVYARTVAA